jgi:hypothetical protein
MVGVVSTAPHTVMGRSLKESLDAPNPQPIALAGRTPVKVSLENGPIKAGDMLVVASTPGLAAKMVKAGDTIGTALEDYEPPPDGSVGKVMMFVSTGYSSGAMTNFLLEKAGIDTEVIPAELDIGRVLLAQLLIEKKDITSTSTLSEIYTDRVVAGLEIISPRVVTDTLVTDSIEPVEDDIRMKIVEGGRLVIERVSRDALSLTFGPKGPPGISVVSIDELGNAFFAGALTGSSLEIGSPGAPSGITLYDTETGEPYCTKVVRGQLITVSGKCSGAVTAPPAVEEAPSDPELTSSPAEEASPLETPEATYEAPPEEAPEPPPDLPPPEAESVAQAP